MIYKRNKWYWMDNVVNDVRYREPLKTKNWQEAKTKEKERLVEIAQGKAGAHGVTAKQTFDSAADLYIEDRMLHSAEKTCRTDRERSRPLRKAFGDQSLRKIKSHQILAYQKARLDSGVSGRTINLEVGLLRRILKKYKQWARIADDVRMLPEQPKPARVLKPHEKRRLLEVASLKPEWEIAYYATVLALNTTMRSCEIRGLRWKNIDLEEKTLEIRRQTTKTDAGARVIPLNRDAQMALAHLRSRSEQLGADADDAYVFPACEHGEIRESVPMKGWRTAWRSLTKAAELKGLRFHDLRHQAITELAESNLSDQTIMSIAGHVSRRMLEHYSHIRTEAKRHAVECLEMPSDEVSQGAPNSLAKLDASAYVTKHVTNARPEDVGTPQPIETTNTPAPARTGDPLLRRQVLYPAELRAHTSPH